MSGHHTTPATTAGVETTKRPTAYELTRWLEDQTGCSRSMANRVAREVLKTYQSDWHALAEDSARRRLARLGGAQ